VELNGRFYPHGGLLNIDEKDFAYQLQVRLCEINVPFEINEIL